MYIIEAWIEHPIRQIDQTFTYVCEEPVEQGCRILVDFNHRKTIGFVETVKETSQTLDEIQKEKGMEIKPVLEVMDHESLLSDELHDLALWMAKTTLSTTISCFQAMLPSKIKPTSNNQKIRMEKWVKLTEEEVDLTPKQLEAYLYIQNHLPLTYAELRKAYPNQARQLVEKGIIFLEEKEKQADTYINVNTTEDFDLKPAQQKAMEEIVNSNDNVYLVKGVTGSGKTEVYLQLAREALKKGKQVLFLVPEIGLTPQMIERVSSRFGEDLAIYHSGLNDQEKYEQYRKVQSGKCSIVVGTRSSIFLPFTNLGLIVLDEEHDHSYKQDNQPTYHCRDIAIYRGQYHQCKVILGSATPSLDSYARALKNVYHLVEMNQRINESLPTIDLVNMKENIRSGHSYILSEELKTKMQDRLDKHEQIILLLNRRGYARQLRCKHCQEVLLCPHCDLALHYHREDQKLKCHACGTELHVPKICPSCGKQAGFSSFGYGTQKLEEEIKQVFPGVSVLRMDRDTTSRKNGHEKILTAFGEGKADILLGTQMIAKGLDYPNVTLVGILNADDGLQRTDFRSCETTFDLLMQASGRSGRANKQGEVLYQVYDENHYAITCAIQQDYDLFFKKEMQFRHAGQYPPYTYMISLTLSGKNEEAIIKEGLSLKEQLESPDYKTIGILTLLKIQDRYRIRILLKGKDLDVMRSALQNVLKQTTIRSSMQIDVNPMSFD